MLLREGFMKKILLISFLALFSFNAVVASSDATVIAGKALSVAGIAAGTMAYTLTGLTTLIAATPSKHDQMIDGKKLAIAYGTCAALASAAIAVATTKAASILLQKKMGDLLQSTIKTSGICSAALLGAGVTALFGYLIYEKAQEHRKANCLENSLIKEIQNHFVQELTQENANAFIKNTSFALVNFSASWCKPCKRFKPSFEELSIDFKDQCTFAKVDIDQCPGFADTYNVSAVPTLIIFKNGKEIKRITGFIQKEALREIITNNI